MTLKLEGRLAGPWVSELAHLWEQIAPKRKGRKIALDLRSTTFADAGGLEVLRSIYSQTAAELLTATPWTQYLAEEIARTAAQNGDSQCR